MQHGAFRALGAAVNRIAEQRCAQPGGGVDADLVGAAGFGAEFDQCRALPACANA